MKTITLVVALTLCVTQIQASDDFFIFDPNNSPILEKICALDEACLKQLSSHDIPKSLTKLIKQYKNTLDSYQAHPTIEQLRTLEQVETLLIRANDLIEMFQEIETMGFRDQPQNLDSANLDSANLDSVNLIQENQQQVITQLSTTLNQANNAIHNLSKEPLGQRLERYKTIAKWTLGTAAAITAIALSIYFGKKAYDYIFDPDKEQRTINETHEIAEELLEDTKEVKEEVHEVQEDIEEQGDNLRETIAAYKGLVKTINAMKKKGSNDEKFARVLVTFEQRLNKFEKQTSQEHQTFGSFVSEIQKELNTVKEELDRQSDNTLLVAQSSYGRPRAKTDADIFPSVRLSKEERSGTIIDRIKTRLLALAIKFYVMTHPNQGKELQKLLGIG
ncbi:hypothetical protein KAT92_01050 [Candidatus Babeliales bacterium]|nr:hypothetical protein [Candidatus Babeliales bacterium]